MTWNVWFGSWMREEREVALWEQLDALEPDVICLQEVVPEHLLGAALTRRRERGDWLSAESIHDYDVLLLSRLLPRSHERVELPSIMGRALELVRLPTEPPLTVATVHLESTKGEQRARIEQLGRIVTRLMAEPNVVLVGDMNFPPGDPAESLVRDWRDAWIALRRDEPGYTVDSQVNLMRRMTKPKPKRERIDRVFVRGQWRVTKIERLGMEPITPGDLTTYVSDHFGLLVELSA